MKTYQLTYIISSEITSEEAEIFAREIDSLIQSKEGVVVVSERPIAKTLAFPIKGAGSGYFAISEFQIEPEKIKEIEEKLQKEGKVLRHMINVKKPVKIQKERRTKRKPEFTISQPEKIEEKQKTQTVPEENKTEKKVELEEIDKKLDEILGE